MTLRASTASAAALAAFVVAGCGSSATKTVSVSGGVGTTSAPARAASTTGTPSTQTATVPTTGTGSAPTRTATAPAFTEHTTGGTSSGGGEGLEQAVATVRAHGFTASETSEYKPNQTLRVLVGTRTGSADGYEQQAFFFLDGRYIGTDTSAPSAGIDVLAQSDTEVSLAYRLYRPGDPLCCARGGQATVRFQLDNGRLVALDPIPPVDSSSAGARR